MKLLSSTEGNYAFKPIIILKSSNTVLFGNEMEEEEEEEDSNRKERKRSMAILSFNIESKIVNRNGFLELKTGANGDVNVCDVGRGEIVMYVEHRFGENGTGLASDFYVDVFISEFHSQTIQRERRTTIDLMEMVASPTARIIALSDLYGTAIWCAESMNTLYTVAKGDVTFSMKIILHDTYFNDSSRSSGGGSGSGSNTSINEEKNEEEHTPCSSTIKKNMCATLVSSDQRGVVSWWEFELPVNRQKYVPTIDADNYNDEYDYEGKMKKEEVNEEDEGKMSTAKSEEKMSESGEKKRRRRRRRRRSRSRWVYIR
jgi:hypothetical protein